MSAEKPMSGAVEPVMSFTCRCGKVVAIFSDTKAGPIMCSKGHPIGYYGGLTAPIQESATAAVPLK